jgi:hypothetical protein
MGQLMRDLTTPVGEWLPLPQPDMIDGDRKWLYCPVLKQVRAGYYHAAENYFYNRKGVISNCASHILVRPDYISINWLDLRDHKPYDGQYVWYYFECTGVSYGQSGDNGNYFHGPLGFLTGDVTAWVPAPPPPCEEISNG